MLYDPQRHARRSIRLPEYDYSRPGAYFVTLCVQHRACLLGEVVAGSVRASPAGALVESEWRRLNERFEGVSLDALVVMPSHLHAIIHFVGARFIA